RELHRTPDTGHAGTIIAFLPPGLSERGVCGANPRVGACRVPAQRRVAVAFPCGGWGECLALTALNRERGPDLWVQGAWCEVRAPEQQLGNRRVRRASRGSGESGRAAQGLSGVSSFTVEKSCQPGTRPPAWGPTPAGRWRAEEEGLCDTWSVSWVFPVPGSSHVCSWCGIALKEKLGRGCSQAGLQPALRAVVPGAVGGRALGPLVDSGVGGDSEQKLRGLRLITQWAPGCGAAVGSAGLTLGPTSEATFGTSSWTKSNHRGK
ncbi:hypothetical protein P7K49_000019, partial [Saguinus oedipus]